MIDEEDNGNPEQDEQVAQEAFARAFKEAKGNKAKALRLFEQEARENPAIIRACARKCVEDVFKSRLH